MNDIFFNLIANVRSLANVVSEISGMYGSTVETDAIVEDALKSVAALERMITNPAEEPVQYGEFEEHLCRSKKVCGD